MKHYVQYHNTDAQGGRPAASTARFQVFTKKPVQPLIGHTVWLVSGEGKSPKRYALEYAFVVEGVTVGEPNTAWGTQGQRFDPPLSLNGLPWCRDFVDSQTNFSLGLREMAPEFLPHFEALRSSGHATPAPHSPQPHPDRASVGDYLQGLRQVQAQWSPVQLEMLVGHANAPESSLSMAGIAACGGFDNFETANSRYGALGRMVADALGFTGLRYQTEALAVLLPEPDAMGRDQWQMRPALRAALRQLRPDDVLPEPMDATTASALDSESLPPTERSALVQARIGQGRYRKGLLALWQGRCALTGLDIEPVLVASHAKPWRDCSNAERLDPFNGLLLSATFDRLFDSGLIAFGDGGDLLVSPQLSTASLQRLGLSRDARLRGLQPQHLPYLQAHRQIVFKRSA